MLGNYKGAEDDFPVEKPGRLHQNQLITMDILSMEQSAILYYLIQHNEKNTGPFP